MHYDKLQEINHILNSMVHLTNNLVHTTILLHMNIIVIMNQINRELQFFFF